MSGSVTLPAPAPPPRTGALFKDSTEALKALREEYNYWTTRLTDTSLQLSLALIAANWAVFGSADAILASVWSQVSLGLVVLALVSTVLGAKWMGELHRRQIEYAGEDCQRWDQEAAKAMNKKGPWPFTRGIEVLGRTMREIKVWVPVLAAIAFLTALLAK